jgi:hypothetical protein
MAAYAFVEGFMEEQPPTGPNQRGRCMVKGQPCLMYSTRIPEDELPAGVVGYRWSHIPLQNFHVLGKGEFGEWHLATQACFGNRGAELERPFPTPPGEPNHRADVVLPDGRVIEVQSRFLKSTKMLSREETYGHMAWIYDATAFGNWFQSKSDKADDERFVWGNKNADFRYHGNRPVYFDCGYQGVYFLQSMTYKRIDTPKGKRDSYDGVRIKVADNMIQFADQLVAGAPFVECPRMNMKPEKAKPRERPRKSLELARKTETCDRASDRPISAAVHTTLISLAPSRAEALTAAATARSNAIKDERDERNRHLDAIAESQKPWLRQRPRDANVVRMPLVITPAKKAALPWDESLGVARAAFRKEPVLSPLRYPNGQIMDQHCQSCGDVLRFGVTRVLCIVCETK